MDGFFQENPIKMDDLGVPLFSETSIYIHPFQNCFVFLSSTSIYITVESLDLRKIRLEKDKKNMIPNAGEKW